MPHAPHAIILAAGKGTRMRSDLPKVCHPVGGRAMVCAVVDACLDAGCERVIVIVGYMQELVRGALAGYGDRVAYAVQDQQLGTGHAVRCAQPYFAQAPRELPVYVLCGDGPLIRPATLRHMAERHATAGAHATLATSVIDDPTGYGRIVRDAAGRFSAIVEHKNAAPEQLAIREINPSYYLFSAGPLFDHLARVGADSVSGEYYLTDVPGLILRDRGGVEVIPSVSPEDVLSINTPEQLAEVDRIFRARGRAVPAAAPAPAPAPGVTP